LSPCRGRCCPCLRSEPRASRVQQPCNAAKQAQHNSQHPCVRRSCTCCIGREVAPMAYVSKLTYSQKPWWGRKCLRVSRTVPWLKGGYDRVCAVESLIEGSVHVGSFQSKVLLNTLMQCGTDKASRFAPLAQLLGTRHHGRARHTTDSTRR
jgi:hypothetical protein